MLCFRFPECSIILFGFCASTSHIMIRHVMWIMWQNLSFLLSVHDLSSPDIQMRRRSRDDFVEPAVLGFVWQFSHSFFFISSCSLVGWMGEQEFARADMMFPRSGHGPARLLTVIYFSLPVACSLPRRGCVEWCANPLYSSDKCIDQYKQTGGHESKWKP